MTNWTNVGSGCTNVEFTVFQNSGSNPVAQGSSQGGSGGSVRSRGSSFSNTTKFATRAKCKDGPCAGKSVFLGAAQGPYSGTDEYQNLPPMPLS